MKKLFVSAGLAAIGTASLQASSTYAPDITAMDASKLWTISGTLRGYYDDNYTTGHSDATGKRASWGFELSPQLSFIVPLQQTELGLRYTYGLYYYQDRENRGANPIDQSHEADLWIDHDFSERWEGKVEDTFVDSQEPQLTVTGSQFPYRTEGNNIDNTGVITVHTDWSLLFSTDLGYQNNYVQYQNHGTTIADFLAKGPSYGGLFDEIGHLIWLNLNYEDQPNLTFLAGYLFGINNYIGNEPIALGPLAGEVYFSDSRDSYSHYLYIGAKYSITENLSATAEAGIQVSDNYNLPSFDTQGSWSYQPYAQIAATYTYLPGSYVQAGFTESEDTSDIATSSGATAASQGIALFQETSVLYASVNHQITPDLLASVIGHYQYSTYQGGSVDGSGQAFYDVGLNLTYNINLYLSVEIGYNFDYVTAAGGLQSYSRNREYVGITGTF